jgi:hypothetical protein
MFQYDGIYHELFLLSKLKNIPRKFLGIFFSFYCIAPKVSSFISSSSSEDFIRDTETTQSVLSFNLERITH